MAIFEDRRLTFRSDNLQLNYSEKNSTGNESRGSDSLNLDEWFVPLLSSFSIKRR